MFDFTGLEPVSHTRVPNYTISQYKPSLFIKPEATGNGCDDYFERSRASGSNRST